MISLEQKKLLEKQHYGLVGNHSSVKVCEWTKKSLRSQGVCYKEKFYGKLHGIKSHRCLQMTPATYFCPNRCLYCWRATDKTEANDMDGFGEDEPKDIVDGAILAQRKQLTGFKGFSGTDMVKWKESQDPTNVAISLTGEPTAYSRISDLITEYKRRKMAVFLVTNGQFPKHISGMDEPSQFYLSVDAPTKEIYKKIDVPQFSDYWERFNQVLSLMPSMSCKTAVRLTVVKGWNDKNIDDYVRLIEKSDADFVEIKAYMHVGFSQYRLPMDAMPNQDYVVEFTKKINEKLGYVYKDEDARSRVVLLSKK